MGLWKKRPKAATLPERISAASHHEEAARYHERAFAGASTGADADNLPWDEKCTRCGTMVAADLVLGYLNLCPECTEKARTRRRQQILADELRDHLGQHGYEITEAQSLIVAACQLKALIKDEQND